MKIKSLIALSSAALMCGCFGDETITNASQESKETSVITLKVVDSKTGLPIDSAIVYSELSQDTMYSDSMGLVTWKKNVLGDYSYIVTKDGYASQLAMVKVEETGKGNVPRVPNQIIPVSLHMQGVAVNGTILVKDTKTDNLSAASKIPVVARYIDGDVYPAEVTTSTNASGVFSFDNLAENARYQIVVPQAEIDGQTYEVSNAEGEIVVSGLRSGESRSLNPITMEVVGLLPELIRSNIATLDTIDEGSYIRLVFSTELVQDSVPNAWSVYKGGYVEGNSCMGGNEVLVAAALDRDDKTVIINSVSNKWNRRVYCLEGSVFTKEGRSQKFAMTFNPGSLSERPSNVTKIAYDDTNYLLSWTVVKEEKSGLSGYKIFYRTNRMADAVEYRTITNSETTEIIISIYDNRFDDATFVVFYVLPYAEINGKIVTSDASDEDLPLKKVIFE